MTPSLNPWGLPSEYGSEKHFGRKARKMREEERAKRRIDFVTGAGADSLSQKMKNKKERGEIPLFAGAT